MNRAASLILCSLVALLLAACQSHPTLRYKPEEYAKLRDLQLLVKEPTRPYKVMAYVEGSGGRHTTTNTMINTMIDAAREAGAEALIPLESVAGARSATGLDVFVYTENNRTITKGRAIRWDYSAPRE